VKTYLLAVSAALLAASGAGAQTIDFSSLDLGALTAPVQIGDYLITPALGGSSTPQVISIDGQNVITTYDNYSGDDTFITRVDGGFFSLDSVVIGISGGTGTVGDNQVGFGLSYWATSDTSPQSVDLGTTFQHVKWVDLDSINGAYYVSFHVTPEAAAAVPEPASWALMLGGFGMVGGAMRSRRKAAVSFG
jgi:hypothetical protein